MPVCGGGSRGRARKVDLSNEYLCRRFTKGFVISVLLLLLTRSRGLLHISTTRFSGYLILIIDSCQHCLRPSLPRAYDTHI